MVYTPRSYLIPAAVAFVALQMQQASATSLFYDPYTSADTTDEISSKFPARGAEVADKDCAITVEVDPTLPDIATISSVTVTYTDLLANTSTAPTESVSTKVGTVIYSVDTPAASANQDAYTTTTTTSTSTSTSTTSTSQTSTTSSAGGTKTSTKTGTTVSQTSTLTSTTTSTTTGTKSGSESATSAPATTAPATTSSSVGGSTEEATSASNSAGGSTHEDTDSSSVGGSSYEESTTTVSPTKTGVTSAPETTSSDVGAPSDEATTATVSPSKTGVTTAPAATETSVAGSSYEEPSTAAATASPTKTGVTSAPATTATDVEGASASTPKDCATGWEDQSSRKLRHSPMSGRRLQEKMEKKRRLEANTNKDIAKLEAYFGTSMEVNLASLPTTGVHTPSPWPGPYWPTYQDSINVIWSAGEPSAAEKYATAFGLDVTAFMDKVSKDNGIDSMSSHTVCSSDSDCSSLTDGSSCAIRTGKSSGYCIPTWYGICHAWTPASMLEEEPRCAVTYNGVTFQPMDIKALLSDVYDGATVTTVFTGTRYNGGTDSTDEYGRHSSDSYRDLNPAYFHIAAANLLGKLNATFIADVTAGSEVWNQPVRGFKVYEQTHMTLEEAASTFYGLKEYPWNSAAKSIVYVKTRLSWIFETYTDGALVSTGKVDSYTTGQYYYYILEMDDDGNIIGGEWVYDSDDDHPDFIWFPKAKPAADTVTSIGLSYADVSLLLQKSVACEGSSSGSTAAGSAESSTLASNVASSAGSTASSSQPGSASSTTASTSSSNTAATVAPVTEAPAATDAPVATEATTTSSTWTTTAPAATTATPSTNQWTHSSQGSGHNRGSWLSFFHWW